MADQGDGLARLLAGEPDSWEALYRRIYPAMVAYAQRRLGSAESARDAVSEALARAVGSLDRLAVTGGTPEAWCFGILRHVVVDEQRRTYRRRDAAVQREIDDPQPSERIELTQEHAAVRAAFALLDERDRELLELRVVAGLQADEVAQVLDMRPGTVRMAQARALSKLRGLLGGASS